MKNKIIIVMLILLSFLGCAKKEKIESKSMDEIYKTEGIPVKVKKLVTEDFSTTLTFNSTLTAYKQSFASAMVGGRIDKINVKVGDYVKKDSVIIEFPLDAPSAQYSQAKAAYELAQKTYDRMKNLYNAGGISKQNLDQVETQLKVSKANWNTVQQLLKVRAPIDGFVTSINVNVSDNVRRETILATISQPNKLKTRIWVTADEAMQIKRGMKAFATWKSDIIYGKVTDIDDSMNPKHNAFGVNLLFDNPKNTLKSGVIAEISIKTYDNPNAIVIPRKIVKSDDEGKYVFIVSSDKKAYKQYFKLGREEGEEIEVLSGLKAGDKVIIEGFNIVYNNAKVKLSD